MKKKESLVSIIVPVYNVEKYLRKCLDSIISQTYKNIEVIIINDGSTDNCENICKEYESKDKRIKLISQNNKGVSAARNLAIKNIAGEYIYFVDSDDYIEVDTIHKMVDIIVKTGSDIVCCNYYIEQVTGEKKIGIYNCPKKMKKNEYIDNLLSNNSISGFLWNKLYKKDFFIESNIRFDEDIKIMEDLLLNLKLSKSIEKVSFIEFPLYHYVQRPNSALNSKNIIKMKSSLNSYLKIIELLNSYEKNAIANKYKITFIIDYSIVKMYSKTFKSDELEATVKNYIKQGIFKTKGNLKIKIKGVITYYFPFMYKLFKLIKEKKIIKEE